MLGKRVGEMVKDKPSLLLKALILLNDKLLQSKHCVWGASLYLYFNIWVMVWFQSGRSCWSRTCAGNTTAYCKALWGKQRVTISKTRPWELDICMAECRPECRVLARHTQGLEFHCKYRTKAREFQTSFWVLKVLPELPFGVSFLEIVHNKYSLPSWKTMYVIFLFRKIDPQKRLVCPR